MDQSSGSHGVEKDNRGKHKARNEGVACEQLSRKHWGSKDIQKHAICHTKEGDHEDAKREQANRLLCKVAYSRDKWQRQGLRPKTVLEDELET